MNKKKLIEAKKIIENKLMLVENAIENIELYEELIQEIVDRAGGDTYQEYDFTKEVIKDHSIEDDDFIEGLRDHARGANYHRIADACEDILRDMKHGLYKTKKENPIKEYEKPLKKVDKNFSSLEDFNRNLKMYKNGDIVKSQLITSYNKLKSQDQEKAKEMAKGLEVLPNPSKK